MKPKPAKLDTETKESTLNFTTSGGGQVHFPKEAPKKLIASKALHLPKTQRSSMTRQGIKRSSRLVTEQHVIFRVGNSYEDTITTNINQGKKITDKTLDRGNTINYNTMAT